MRGSPFLRTLLLAGGLLLAGAGILRLVSAPEPAARQAAATSTVPVATDRCPFQLVLSAPASSVRLTSRDGRTLFESAGGNAPQLGVLDLDPKDPAVGISVHWKEGTPGHRFARLTLEPPGRPTLIWYFDSTGDLEDFREPAAASE